MEENFLTRTEFSSYKEFIRNYELRIPENFNFGYDVMDFLAEKSPDARALVWTNDEEEYLELSFGEMKTRSDRAASFFLQCGVRRGDFVMLILQRRYEFWISMIALHKIGAVAIPATHMLTKEDLVYRNNAASVKMIVAVNVPDVVQHIRASRAESPSLRVCALVNEFGVDKPVDPLPDGWVDFTLGCRNAPPFPVLPRSEVSSNSDYMLGYFTSGTTSHPKLAVHDFLYPLGHIVTAKYWQRVRKGGLHLTVADSGWAKTAWGRLYGQWICETALFVYDYHSRFKPTDLLHQVQKHRVTTFCAPPTIYRFLIQEDLSGFDLSSLEHCSTAGEPLSEEVFNQWKRITGLQITEGFGQSETTVSPTSRSNPDQSANRRRITISACWMNRARNWETPWSGKFASSWIKGNSPLRTDAFPVWCANITAIRKRRRKPSMTAIILPATRPGGMKTAVIGSSAAATT